MNCKFITIEKNLFTENVFIVLCLWQKNSDLYRLLAELNVIIFFCILHIENVQARVTDVPDSSCSSVVRLLVLETEHYLQKVVLLFKFFRQKVKYFYGSARA